MDGSFDDPDRLLTGPAEVPPPSPSLAEQLSRCEDLSLRLLTWFLQCPADRGSPAARAVQSLLASAALEFTGTCAGLLLSRYRRRLQKVT